MTAKEQVESVYARTLTAINRSDERMAVSAFLMDRTDDRLKESARMISESWKVLQTAVSSDAEGRAELGKIVPTKTLS